MVTPLGFVGQFRIFHGLVKFAFGSEMVKLGLLVRETLLSFMKRRKKANVESSGQHFIKETNR